MEEASACFKTFHGPTKKSAVRTSVKQGDPLSPLIYIFITDALHEGLRKNPLDPTRKTRPGYRFSNDSAAIVPSTGYADDSMIYAEDWPSIWAMHQWVREFNRAHGLNFNVNKTHFLISNYKGPEDNRWIYSMDGKSKIEPSGPNFVFRYLGIHLNLDLNWNEETARATRKVLMWRANIKKAYIDPAKAATTVREELFPQHLH